MPTSELRRHREGDRRVRDAARDGAITLEELTGGTFTITNGGVFGSLMSTPIVNAPQSAILGMHKIQERPMVVDGQVVVRPMMYLALTYDHRIIDGREAVQFLVTVKEALEDPGAPAAANLEETQMSDQFDVVVIGGGPAGYPAAIRAGQNKLTRRLHRRVEESRRQLRVRRHLPERGLHSVEGAARVLRALSPRARGVRDARHPGVRRLSLDLAAMQKRKARHRQGEHQRHHRAVQERAASRRCRATASCCPANASSSPRHDGSKRELAAKHVVLASRLGADGAEARRRSTASSIVDSWGALEFDCGAASGSA